MKNFLVGIFMMVIGSVSYAQEMNSDGWIELKEGVSEDITLIPGSGGFCIKGKSAKFVQVQFLSHVDGISGVKVLSTHGVTNTDNGYQIDDWKVKKDSSLLVAVQANGDVLIKRMDYENCIPTTRFDYGRPR